MNEDDLLKLARDKKNEYQREWYRKHPGKSAEYTRNHWMRVAMASIEKAGEQK